MFRVICKSSRISVPHNLKEFSSSAKKSIPFTVGYLMNEFGFSMEKAVVASKYIRFENRVKPDAFVSFLKNQGFPYTQIQILVSNYSRILLYNPEKTLLPKIQFFKSKGISSTDLAYIMSCNPQLLERSLKRHISPTFDFFRGFLGSDQSVICMLKQNARLFNYVELRVKPIIEVLTQAGLPHSSIAYLLKNQPKSFQRGSDKWKESIEQVQNMGMDPHRCSYNLALSILTVTPRSKWNEKMEVYKRWGCSEDEVLTSFKILPWVMMISEKKINAVMSFCVKEMGWKPSEVVRTYFLLTLSLNKRIRPRWSVYQQLLSKRLVKDEGKVTKMFKINEELFLEKYVKCYEDEAPFLSKLYLEKLEATQ